MCLMEARGPSLTAERQRFVQPHQQLIVRLVVCDEVYLHGRLSRPAQ